MAIATVKTLFLATLLLITMLISSMVVAASNDSQGSANSYGQTGETVRTGGPVPSEGSAQTGNTAQPGSDATAVDAGSSQSAAPGGQSVQPGGDGSAEQPAAQNGEAIYQKACAICHESGVAQAPKIHDQQAWQARIDAELATVKQEKPDLSPAQQQDEALNRLVGTVKSGKGAMPVGGMCEKCSDAEYKAAIKYMATPSKEQGDQLKAAS